MSHDLSISEQLTYSTVRIKCENSEGNVSTGTGFFYRFCKDEDSFIPAIVTNKHVIKDAEVGEIHINLGTAEGKPKKGKYHKVVFENFENMWIKHQRKDIDLCILPIAPVLSQLRNKNLYPFFINIEKKLIVNNDYLKGLNAIEDIVMIGYPNGIWDSENNMPIIRKGVTATYPGFNYNGKEEFMIDAACFPGSSGSPVFLYNPSGYIDKKGNINMGKTRVKLLGILYAGPQHTATGEIKVVDVPTAQKQIAISRIPNNLGIIIKSYVLNDFETMLE